MAGQITREELRAAQQNKSPKKPHLKLTEKYDICCQAEESPLSNEEYDIITIDRTETKTSSSRKPLHHHLLGSDAAIRGSHYTIIY